MRKCLTEEHGSAFLMVHHLGKHILYFFFFIYFADRASQYIYLNINQLEALNFIMSLFHTCTCFEHVLIVRRSKLYYTASGIITPTGGRPVHSALSTFAPDGHLQV